MTKISKILLLLSVIMGLMLSSCSNKTTDPAPKTFKPQDLAGTWKCTDAGLERDSFEFKADGKIKATLSGQIFPREYQITNWEAAKGKEISKYTLTILESAHGVSAVGDLTFEFTSSSECKVSSSKQPGGVQNFKK